MQPPRRCWSDNTQCLVLISSENNVSNYIDCFKLSGKNKCIPKNFRKKDEKELNIKIREEKKKDREEKKKDRVDNKKRPRGKRIMEEGK